MSQATEGLKKKEVLCDWRDLLTSNHSRECDRTGLSPGEAVAQPLVFSGCSHRTLSLQMFHEYVT